LVRRVFEVSAGMGGKKKPALGPAGMGGD